MAREFFCSRAKTKFFTRVFSGFPEPFSSDLPFVFYRIWRKFISFRSHRKSKTGKTEKKNYFDRSHFHALMDKNNLHEESILLRHFVCRRADKQE
ncbi:DUF1661 domain-containing protein [Porphyromonas gulae]|uniref:DUF1661 domain-containing protein n=1 Tax=Porphyromonas gulae TaxID=111105 RepID=UPI001E54364A|nr:DUF1661 domain-containing protein [Porphyromonas gulae]